MPRFGDVGATALANNNTITTLILGRNNISDVGATALANNNKITYLQLYHNNIGDEGAIALANNNTINKLDLGANKLGDEGAIALANNNTITLLKLNRNNVGDNGARAFANNRTITTFVLGENKISPDGAIALANNNTITYLDLKGNNVGDNGAIAMVKNDMITTLDLRDCRISSDVATALLVELKKNTTLTFLGLYGNDLNKEDSQAINDELMINKACCHLLAKEQRQISKEQIQTLMNIRAHHPGTLLALIPNELMFLLFRQLIPGFDPSTFTQQKEAAPLDEEMIIKARDKLAAIAAQRRSIIGLEPEPALPPQTSTTACETDVPLRRSQVWDVLAISRFGAIPHRNMLAPTDAEQPMSPTIKKR